MSKTRLVLGLAVVLSLALELGIPGRASAGDGRGAFRLSVSSTVVGYRELTLHSPDLGARVPMLAGATARHTSYGLLAPRLGIELGGAVVPEFLLGIEGHVANAISEAPGGSGIESLSWGLAAFGEIALVPRNVVRPFFRLAIGGEGETLSIGGSSAGATLGLRGGVHIFAADSFALAPHLEIRYRAGQWSSGGASGNYEGFEFVLGISVSGWLGGAEPEAIAPATSTRSVRAPAPPRTSPPRERVGSVVADADGIMRMDLSLPGAVGARIAGDPSQDPRTVQFGFARIGPAPTFGSCTQGSLVSGDTRESVEVTVRSEPFHTGVQETVVVRIDRDHVASIVSSPDAHLDLCGVIIDLPASVRAPMRYFVTRFIAAAANFETRAVPTPAQDEPEPDTSSDQIFVAPE